jgi:RNA polymerase sigma-70 factor (ECF subfamily)
MGSPITSPHGESQPSYAFPTTQWSIVLRADAQAGQDVSLALETLCRQYWYPVYGFIRRKGHSHHAAEDLAQAFFARVLENEAIARARPERGRFRTFLLAMLRNFLISEWQREHTVKRGGGAGAFSLDFDGADAAFSRGLADQAMTPEQAFDRTWAVSTVEKALADLRSEYEATGRGPLFEALAPLVWGGGTPVPLASNAQRLGLNEGALKVALHRVRHRLRERLRAHVAATVADDAAVEDEIRYLIAAIGGNSPGV